MNCRAVDSREKYEKFKRQETVKMFTQGDLTFTGLDSGSTELIRQGSGMQESYFEATGISDSLCDFNPARDSSSSPYALQIHFISLSYPFRRTTKPLSATSLAIHVSHIPWRSFQHRTCCRLAQNVLTAASRRFSLLTIPPRRSTLCCHKNSTVVCNRRSWSDVCRGIRRLVRTPNGLAISYRFPALVQHKTRKQKRSKHSPWRRGQLKWLSRHSSVRKKQERKILLVQTEQNNWQ